MQFEKFIIPNKAPKTQRENEIRHILSFPTNHNFRKGADLPTIFLNVLNTVYSRDFQAAM